MKKNRKAKARQTRRAARSGRRMRKLPKPSRRTSKNKAVRKASVHRKQSKAARAKPRFARPKQKPPAAPPVITQKAADEIPTLEQVTITCANCGRPFKVFKLKGLSLEGTICQRCSFGEMELPESFGG